MSGRAGQCGEQLLCAVSVVALPARKNGDFLQAGVNLLVELPAIKSVSGNPDSVSNINATSVEYC